MIVKKGGITRNIDENRLHEYTAKGYAPCAVEATEEWVPIPKKQPKKPTAKE